MPSKRQVFGAKAERRVRLHYRLRGYRVLAANVRAGGNELDVVLRRGRRLVFCEVMAAMFSAGRAALRIAGASSS